MTTTYYDASKPDWTPGPLGRDASELAKITASPKGWIYTFDPVPRTISSGTWAANEATITLPNHGFVTTDSVVIAGCTPNDYNGTFAVTRLTDDTFKYALVVADPGSITVAGTAKYEVSRHIEVLKALRSLDSKITGQTDAETLPTFTAAFTSSAYTGGALTNLVVGVAGTGYGTPDTSVGVTIGAGGEAVAGTAHAASNASGIVTGFTVDTAGTDYTSFPSVTVDAPAGGGVQATGILTMDITGFTVTGGTGYAPNDPNIAVTLSGGGAATQATAHATSDGAGNIDAVILDTAGSGYTSLPTITFPVGNGSATGKYILKSIAVNNAGTGYAIVNANVPVTISSGDPVTPATAHATASEFGVLASFVIDTAGAGYKFVPTITVGGTGANGTGTPTISAMNVATAAVLKVTLTASEAVNVAGTPYIAVDIGAATRNFVYDSALSTDTSLVFKYTVLAGDSALITEVISGAAVSFGTYDGIGDALSATGGTNWLSSVAFTAPVLTNVSVN